MVWKPGHYLLLALGLYALVVTLGFASRERQLWALRQEVAALAQKAQKVPEGYLLPLPGACLPTRPEHLPNAPRPYRKGVSAGFVFQQGDACVPVVQGMGVVAAMAGEVVRVEADYQEPTRRPTGPSWGGCGKGQARRKWMPCGASRSGSATPMAAPRSTPTSRPPTGA